MADTYGIGGTSIGAHIPGIQVDHLCVYPRAVAQAQFQSTYAHNPIR